MPAVFVGFPGRAAEALDGVAQGVFAGVIGDFLQAGFGVSGEVALFDGVKDLAEGGFVGAACGGGGRGLPVAAAREALQVVLSA